MTVPQVTDIADAALLSRLFTALFISDVRTMRICLRPPAQPHSTDAIRPPRHGGVARALPVSSPVVTVRIAAQVVVVCTSNRPPEKLYEGGLNQHV